MFNYTFLEYRHSWNLELKILAPPLMDWLQTQKQTARERAKIDNRIITKCSNIPFLNINTVEIWNWKYLPLLKPLHTFWVQFLDSNDHATARLRGCISPLINPTFIDFTKTSLAQQSIWFKILCCTLQICKSELLQVWWFQYLSIWIICRFISFIMTHCLRELTLASSTATCGWEIYGGVAVIDFRCPYI